MTMEQRQFLRYPVDTPLQVKRLANSSSVELDIVQATNVGYGGLAFISEHAWTPNEVIQVSILIEPPFDFIGKVMWCRKNYVAYEVGIEFMAKKANLFEELLRIEQFCRSVA